MKKKEENTGKEELKPQQGAGEERMDEEKEKSAEEKIEEAVKGFIKEFDKVDKTGKTAGESPAQ